MENLPLKNHKEKSLYGLNHIFKIWLIPRLETDTVSWNDYHKPKNLALVTQVE